MNIKQHIKQYLPIFVLKFLSHALRIFDDRPPNKIIEHMEVDFALSRVWDKRGITVLDIGAHHGEFLEIFGTFNHAHNWTVYSVEPIAENRRYLTIASKKYKNINTHIIPIGISDVSTEKTFYLGSASTLFTCSEDWVKSLPEFFKNFTTTNVKCLTIQDMAKAYGIPENQHFDFIKIDVEDHDFNVIKSFYESKITSSALMFEISSNSNLTLEAINLLKLKGFDEFFIFGRKGIPTTFIGEYTDEINYQNLFNSGRITAGNIVALQRNSE